MLQGRALEGPVYAAAKKAAHMQPLNPAAHNVLGLASGGLTVDHGSQAVWRLSRLLQQS